MTIQIPNLGIGDGLTGDNELVIRQKYNANFSDTTHAANRLVGNGANQLPQAQDIPSLLGTAATKNVGSATGNLVEAQNITAEINTKIAANITQVAGQSTSSAVSQKLFTDTIGNIDAVLNSINGVVA